MTPQKHAPQTQDPQAEDRQRVLLAIDDSTLKRRAKSRLEKRDSAELARLRALSGARERALSDELADAKRRLAFVTAASRALAAALDVDGTLAALASVAVPGLAQWCAIDMLQGGKLVRKASWHQAAFKTAVVERIGTCYSPLDDRRHPIYRALTTGKTELAGEIPVDFTRRIAQSEEHLELMRELDLATYICVPLKVRGQTAGVLALGADSTWPGFTRGDVSLAEDLAARVGAAIERAQLLQSARAELAERKRVEQELRTQQEHEHLILDNIDAMVWYKDTDNRVLRINRAAAEWTGLPIERIEGRRIDQIFGRARALEYLAHDKAVIASGAPLRDFELVQDPDGRERWVQRDTMPHRDETGRIKGVIILAVDVTEQKRVEDALRSNELAQREFVANVSHEFRTPVAAIKGFAETLRAGAWKSAGDRARFLSIIESNADRLNALVEDLLTLSALEEGRPATAVPVDVRSTAIDCAERLTEEARRNELSLAVTVPEGLDVLCDRLHLSQMIDNLLDNAIRFNRPLGTVRLRAERRGEAVWISVEDSGIGIAREHLPRVFDRFFRVEKGATPGRTGLGLHIVKKLGQAYGGKVMAESELGKGSAFYIELPGAPSKKGKAPACEADASTRRPATQNPDAVAR